MGAALGVGLVAGAGTAYLISRLNEHTRLTHQISSLHTTIMEVKREIALLETGKEMGGNLVVSWPRMSCGLIQVKHRPFFFLYKW